MKTLSKVYTALILIFMYAPIAVLIIFSFNSSNSTAVFQGFSLKWYAELFNDEATLQALYNTLILAVCSAIIATILGTAAAVGIDYMKKGPLRSIIMSITNIPMMNADIVTGVAMCLFFVAFFTGWSSFAGWSRCICPPTTMWPLTSQTSPCRHKEVYLCDIM